MKPSLLIILFLNTFILYSQQEDYELITDRPDQTESSTVVPYKFFQIETGMVLENTHRQGYDLTTIAYNTTLLRYGLLPNFELRLGLEYLQDRTKNQENTHTISGTSPLYTGFKINVAQADGWKPEIAFLGGLILPFTANEAYQTTYTASDIRFSFSHLLSNKLSLGYNIGTQWDGESPAPSTFYSVALGMAISNKLGMYAESYGLLPGPDSPEHLLDTGLTYLLRPNFQIDISAGIGLNHNTIDNFLSAGLTIRLPH